MPCKVLVHTEFYFLYISVMWEILVCKLYHFECLICVKIASVVATLTKLVFMGFYKLYEVYAYDASYILVLSLSSDMDIIC